MNERCLQQRVLRGASERQLYTFQPLVWQQQKPDSPPNDKGSEPYPRSGHRIVYHNHSLYSYGGFNNATEEKKEFKELWRFNVSTGRWTCMGLSGITSPNVASMAAVVVDQNEDATSEKAKMLLFGGTKVPFGHALTNKIYLVDLNTGHSSILRTSKDGDESDKEPGGEEPPPPAQQDLMQLDPAQIFVYPPPNILDQAENPDDDDDSDWEDVEEDSDTDTDDEDLFAEDHGAPLDEDLPIPAYGQALVLVKGQNDEGLAMYSVGGTNGREFFSDVHRFLFRRRTWEKCYLTGFNGGPEPSYRHELALWDSKIFMLGGGTSFTVNGFIQIWYFDLSQQGQHGRGEWRSATTIPDPTSPLEEPSESEQFPAPRRCHDCVTRGRYAYIFGGFDGNRIFGDFWQLDLEHLQWKRLSCNQVVPSYFSSSAVTPAGQVFSFGGVVSDDQKTRTNAVHSMWLGVPSLRDMAWQAVLHYVGPEIANMSAETLLLGGVPQDLAKSVAAA